MSSLGVSLKRMSTVWEREGQAPVSHDERVGLGQDELLPEKNFLWLVH